MSCKLNGDFFFYVSSEFKFFAIFLSLEGVCLLQLHQKLYSQHLCINYGNVK